jgi:hypothetical protein
MVRPMGNGAIAEPHVETRSCLGVVMPANLLHWCLPSLRFIAISQENNKTIGKRLAYPQETATSHVHTDMPRSWPCRATFSKHVRI